MKRRKALLKVQYEYVSGKENQRKLDEVFDMIFEKIAEIKAKKKDSLDKSILEDYTVVSLN